MKNKFSVADAIIYLLMAIICVIMIYPLWQTVVGSFMKEPEYLASSLKLFVKDPTIDAYKVIFQDGTIFRHLKLTAFITLIGAITSLFFTTFSAYGLSKEFPGSNILMFLIVVTMFLRPGLIPDYLNLKALGLINTKWVYIFPRIINVFYLIIMRNTFQDFPADLEEAARIDGAGPLKVFFQIVVPLSKPIIAAIGLFFTVQFWNTYMQSVFYVSTPALKTIQEYLNTIIADSSSIDSVMAAAEMGSNHFSSETVRLANVVLVVTPILAIYPLLQRFFIKGMLSGAIKG